MKEFKGKLIERLKRTEAVESFRFLPDDKIDFLPGQFLQVIFDEGDRSNKTLNKYLSFSSRPSRDYIEVTKKISGSGFSKRLMDLKENDTVLFKGPMGNCIFKDEFEKIGFLVGGIGITPVISIFEYIADNQLPTDACLLYSNWIKNDIAFKKELDLCSQKNSKLKVIHALVEHDPEDAGYFSGMISKELVESQMNDYDKRHLFIFGPPAMVTAMKSICSELQCGKGMIKAESFIGY